MTTRAVIFCIMVAVFSNTAMANTTPPLYMSYKVEKTKIKNVNPFCIAIAKGDYVTVQKLIELGEDVNTKSNGMTPLMYAARFNRINIIKLLLANGANAKLKCDKGYTALKYAELSNAKDAKALLLQKQLVS